MGMTTTTPTKQLLQNVLLFLKLQLSDSLKDFVIVIVFFFFFLIVKSSSWPWKFMVDSIIRNFDCWPSIGDLTVDIYHVKSKKFVKNEAHNQLA
jgi:hypothetical protein